MGKLTMRYRPRGLNTANTKATLNSSTRLRSSTYRPKTHTKIILPFPSQTSKYNSQRLYATSIFYSFFVFPILATRSVYFILLHITVLTSDKRYKTKTGQACRQNGAKNNHVKKLTFQKPFGMSGIHSTQTEPNCKKVMSF